MQVDVGRLLGFRGQAVSARGVVNLPEDLGQGFRTEGPAEVQVTVANTGRFLHAEGRIKLRLRAECFRCLGDFRLGQPVIPFTQDYLTPRSASIGEE